ncbi:hypothetical protein [Cellulomonas sp.]|uniref:hypothetical protein n=1 Tax=Cellulomonas sp. TaxID=40001 RepID=UPI002D47F1A8|nr:hypothetical protein [Cellulomonas sp.]HYQ74681.1 hypothetical protein [Cellulomonas sp.]
MGTTGYGRRVAEDGGVVRYAFGTGPDAVDGILVIPLDDPDRWYVEGREDRPVLARNVLHAALRSRRREGAWPRDASFFS